jgi:hypothetical protein
MATRGTWTTSSALGKNTRMLFDPLASNFFRLLGMDGNLLQLGSNEETT